MCDVRPRSTSLHFASSSTVVISHLVFMLSGSHTVNQKIQLCLSIFYSIVRQSFQCLTSVYIAYFEGLIYYRTSAHAFVNASVCPFVNACINVCST